MCDAERLELVLGLTGTMDAGASATISMLLLTVDNQAAATTAVNLCKGPPLGRGQRGTSNDGSARELSWI